MKLIENSSDDDHCDCALHKYWEKEEEKANETDSIEDEEYRIAGQIHAAHYGDGT